MDKPTIFVSIASMDDSEVVPTVVNAFNAATHPERIRVGVGLAALDKKIYKQLNKIYKNDSRLRMTYEKIKRNDLTLLGIGKGRYRAARLYKDEDYMLQIDCHTRFEDGWDETMISIYEGAKKASGNPKTILTTYIGVYSYQPERKPVFDRNAYPFFVPSALWMGAVPRWTDLPLSEVPGKEFKEPYYPNVKFNPACAFGDKEWAKDTGVDREAIFYDEDLKYSINLYDRGFSFVYPNLEHFPITHLNSDFINEHGGERMFFTDYVDKKTDEEISRRLVVGYVSFLNDPANAEKIKKFEKYARINTRFGAITEYYIPSSYRVD